MPLVVGSPYVEKVEKKDKNGRVIETKWKVCVDVENDSAEDVRVCVTIFRMDHWQVGGSNVRVDPVPQCTRGAKLKKKHTINHPLGSATVRDKKKICCDLPGEPPNGTVFKATTVNRWPCRGHNEYQQVGESGPIGIYNRPKRVAALPGEKLRHSAIMGLGLDTAEGVVLSCALNLPVGWHFEFEDSKGDPDEAPFAVVFAVTPRPGASIGEFAEVTLRTAIKKGKEPLEEATIQIAIGDQDEEKEPTDPQPEKEDCDC